MVEKFSPTPPDEMPAPKLRSATKVEAEETTAKRLASPKALNSLAQAGKYLNFQSFKQSQVRKK